MKINKKIALLIVFITTIITGCVTEEVINKDIILVSINSVAKYGTYFGAKSGKLDDKKAKYIEESLRVCIQLIKNDKVEDFVDIDKVIEKIPAEAKPYLEEAINIVNSKYVTIKGKISVDKICYIEAIFNGAFSGIENYRDSLNSEAAINSGIEIEIANEYKKAKDVLNK